MVVTLKKPKMIFDTGRKKKHDLKYENATQFIISIIMPAFCLHIGSCKQIYNIIMDISHFDG